MATIFRPYYTGKDPATGERIRKRLRKYYVELVDARGIRRRIPGYVDKEATRQLAARLEKEAALEAEGVVDPFAEHRRRPLREHLEDFEAFLQSKQNSKKHVRLTSRRIETCLDGCGFKLMGDLDANRLAQWLKDRRAAELSARTSNFYLSSMKSFVRWLQRSRRIADNPLAHLDGVLVDELRSLDSDLLSTADSNDTIGRIIIERLDRASVAVIAIGVHRPEQFLDNVPFLNFLVPPPIPKRSILPTVPNYGVHFVADVIPTHLCA